MGEQDAKAYVVVNPHTKHSWMAFGENEEMVFTNRIDALDFASDEVNDGAVVVALYRRVAKGT